MVAGRVASSIAAGFGTMRVTEQIDALTTLSTDPMKYLVLPRIFAGLVALPLLVAVGDVIGIFGGYLVGTTRLGFNPPPTSRNPRLPDRRRRHLRAFVKAAAFGFLLTLMGCYDGFHSGHDVAAVVFFFFFSITSYSYICS